MTLRAANRHRPGPTNGLKFLFNSKREAGGVQWEGVNFFYRKKSLGDFEMVTVGLSMGTEVTVEM